jgi:hypothetical protein
MIMHIDSVNSTITVQAFQSVTVPNRRIAMYREAVVTAFRKKAVITVDSGLPAGNIGGSKQQASLPAPAVIWVESVICWPMQWGIVNWTASPVTCVACDLSAGLAK